MSEREAEYMARRATGENLWRNRIVGYGDVSPDSLRANVQNWRRHPQDQQAALGDLLGEIGVVQNIMVNRRTGDDWPVGERNVETIVDGHLRVMLALRSKQPLIPVTYVDLTPGEEALVLASFDPVAAMALADKVALDAVLRQVETESAAIASLLGRVSGYDGLEEDRTLQEIDVDNLPERPVWILSTCPHALMPEVVPLLDKLREIGVRVEIANE